MINKTIRIAKKNISKESFLRRFFMIYDYLNPVMNYLNFESVS